MQSATLSLSLALHGPKENLSLVWQSVHAHDVWQQRPSHLRQNTAQTIPICHPSSTSGDEYDQRHQVDNLALNLQNRVKISGKQLPFGAVVSNKMCIFAIA